MYKEVVPIWKILSKCILVKFTMPYYIRNRFTCSSISLTMNNFRAMTQKFHSLSLITVTNRIFYSNDKVFQQQTYCELSDDYTSNDQSSYLCFCRPGFNAKLLLSYLTFTLILFMDTKLNTLIFDGITVPWNKRFDSRVFRIMQMIKHDNKLLHDD